MRRLQVWIAGVSAVAVCVSASPAHACTYMPAVLLKASGPPDLTMAETCNDAARQKNRLLDRARAGKLPVDRLSDLTDALYTGDRGCKPRQVLAIALLDAAIGSPPSLQSDNWLLASLIWKYRDLPPKLQSPGRLEQLRRTGWLINKGKFILEAPSWTSAEQGDFIAHPDHWPIAEKLLAEDSERGGDVVRALLDPTNARFDAKRGIEVAEQRWNYRNKALAALLLTDPVSHASDYVRAEKLVDWYEGGGQFSDQPEVMELAARAWHRIAHFKLKQPDPQARMRGWAFLTTGNPKSKVDLEFARKVSGRGGYLELSKFPDGIAFRKEVLTNDDFPPAAARAETGGVVKSSAIFGPDGKLVTIQVTDAFPELAGMTARAWNARSDLKKVVLLEFLGRYVRIPLPDVEWRIPAEGVKPPPAGINSEGRYVVWLDMTESCCKC